MCAAVDCPAFPCKDSAHHAYTPASEPCVLRQTYARIQRDSQKEYVYMRQGLLLDLLFRTPSIPPSLTLAVIIMDRTLRALKQPPILGNVDNMEPEEGTKRRHRSTRSRRHNRFPDSQKRLFGGRLPSDSTPAPESVSTASPPNERSTDETVPIRSVSFEGTEVTVRHVDPSAIDIVQEDAGDAEKLEEGVVRARVKSE